MDLERGRLATSHRFAFTLTRMRQPVTMTGESESERLSGALSTCRSAIPLRRPYWRVGVGSSGRWRALSGSLFTSSMIFAYARVDASRPVHGTVCGVSRSVWK